MACFSSFKLLVSLLCIVFAAAQPEAQECNGDTSLCQLKFNQVSFAGTHNSGSGFAGSLRTCDGMFQIDCVWRNQQLNITAQLDLGIRFLEIDLCLLPQNCNSTVYGSTTDSKLFTCHSMGTVRYSAPVMQVFQQINDWLNTHPREVIGIYFPVEFPIEDSEQIFTELKTILESMWLKNVSNTAAEQNVYMSTYFNDFGVWPTLGDAILANERIFVFLDNSSHSGGAVPWVNPTAVSTYVPPLQPSNDCDPAWMEHANRCNTEGDIVLAVGYTLGVCLINGQENCNMFLPNVANLCYSLRKNYNQTVNVILVDFPESSSNISVFQVVEFLNGKNIEVYSPPAESTVMSSLSSDSVVNLLTTSSQARLSPLCTLVFGLDALLYLYGLGL